jgi:cyclophilin family peptidyl-prolyl cis-trans isomerase
MTKFFFLILLFGSLSTFAANPKVVIETNQGTIEVELFEDKCPKTVKNFLSYVEKKFYDGTIFHRVINQFMIQGGGFTQNMVEKKTFSPIVNEAREDLKNLSGTIAMARTADPNSATSQFFINVVDNEFLNYKGPSPEMIGYAVFGKVTKGMHVVERIKSVKTGRFGPHENVPMDPVIIKKIRKNS